MDQLLQISEKDGVPVIDSRLISSELGVEHRATLQIIEKYSDELQLAFGTVAFEMLPLPNGGLPQRVAYLNEDQAIFIATLSRNSEQVVKFKSRLVQAFQAARKVINQLSAAEMKLQVFRMLEQEAESLRTQNQLLEKTIKEQAPKVEYCMKVLDSHSDITTTLIAKELGMAAKTLNLKLKDLGIQYKQNDTWVLKAKYQDKGYTLSRTTTYTDALGNSRTAILTTWTEKGRMFIHNLLSQPKAA